LLEFDKGILLVNSWSLFINFWLSFMWIWLSLLGLAWSYRTLWLVVSSFWLWLQSFKCIRVRIDLPSDCIVILLHFSIYKSNLTENFTNLSQTVDLSDVIPLAVQKLHSCLLNLGLFFLAVAGVIDSTSVCECVMHG